MCTLLLLLLLPFGRVALGGLQTESTVRILYNFLGGHDGANPTGRLIMDEAGNLYGTTEGGGANSYGTVFKLTADGTETILHDFGATGDGSNPSAGLIRDSAGNLYGTTTYGGVYNSGTVFKLEAQGNERVLYSFAGGSDGAYPYGDLIRDNRGNLYGTTSSGGARGKGTVFKLAPNGTETVLYSFGTGSDGRVPLAGVIRDKQGNLYGTTAVGGATGNGTVFKLAPDGTETVLYSFSGTRDGSQPYAELIRDKHGNLYGTTFAGGVHGDGVVFKLAPNGAETVLHAFGDEGDGEYLYAGVIQDRQGNLYGATVYGGPNDGGTVFKLAPDGTETVLYAFGYGGGPYASLIQDGEGNLYGTTYRGLDNSGSIFEIEN